MITKRLPKVAWRTVRLDTVAEIRTGVAKGAKPARRPIAMPYLRVANVQAGSLDLGEIKELLVEADDVERYSLRVGDVLMTEGGDFDKLGRGAIWRGEIEPCLHQNHVFAVRCNAEKLLPEWLSWVSESDYGRRYFQLSSKQSTNLASINSSQLKAFPLPLPRRPQQEAIARILRATERVIGGLSKLIDAKRELKRGVAQQLLTGQKRFPEFVSSKARKKGEFGTIPKEWTLARIGDIAGETSERGASDDSVVYSCTKHNGLVPSLEYFGKQVFSRNLDSYKRLHTGDFAYATNHIEEGSIGLLRPRQKPGLVSPMYTVFRCDKEVNLEFLFALLKSENYRRVFEKRTSASVDRRGSLRWAQFSQIRVPMPSRKEQDRIAKILSMLDDEIRLLMAQRENYSLYKRGLLARLLSGELPIAP